MDYLMPYNREKAVEYADTWAMGRNPAYYDYSNLGGDCTNFISQCLYAGGGIMNYTRDLGWYYNNVTTRHRPGPVFPICTVFSPEKQEDGVDRTGNRCFRC